MGAQHLEAKLQPNTILVGDFNVDLRRKTVTSVTPEKFPNLAKMLSQAQRLPSHLGTNNKQRSAFQAQVSKMFLQDFSMKDFALLGEAFCPAPLEGLISRTHSLPDAECPSDHAPLSFVLRMCDS